MFAGEVQERGDTAYGSGVRARVGVKMGIEVDQQHTGDG